MKVQTTKKSRFGVTTTVNGVEVEWNNSGVGIIKDKEVAIGIIAEHVDIYEEGKVPEIKELKAEGEKGNSEDISKLNAKISVLSNKLESREYDIKTLEAVKAQMILDSEEQKKSAIKTFSGEDVDTIISMLDASKEDLVEIASEDKENLPKEEWEELNKKELVKYLFLKSN